MFSYSLEQALYGLTRFPKSTVLVVLTVALGLAACMTTLTLLHVLSADPLPGRSQHLYRAFVNTVKADPQPLGDSAITGVSRVQNTRLEPATAKALLAAHKAVRQAAMADIAVNVTSGNGQQTMGDQEVLATNAAFFVMFGVRFVQGHAWSATADAEGQPLAVIDTFTAEKLFGTTAAVGKSLHLGHTVFRITGVIEPFAPQPHFFGLNSWNYGSGDNPGEGVFIPWTAAMAAHIVAAGANYPALCDADSRKSKEYSSWNTHRCAWLDYWVELDTPQQVVAFKAYLTHYAQQQKTLAGYKKPAVMQLDSVFQWLKKKHVVPDSVRLNVWLAIAFLVLCMANVAGLLTARFLRRSSEIGVRRALGAPRRAVFVRCVAESTLACIAGGIVGLPLTLAGLWLVRQQSPDFSALAQLDTSMFIALFVLAVVVGALVGLIPAWRTSRVEPGLAVKGL